MNTKSYRTYSPIGGYFELELNKGREYHKSAIALNTGRNCLEYILRVRKYDKVFIPYYTCDVIWEPFKKTGTEFEFYHVNINLEPVDVLLKHNEALLYTNYFGIKSNTVRKLAGKYKNIIVDNSQSFFDRPLKNTDTFYSPRKFFGVSDGGYLYINKTLKSNFERDVSYKRFSHLLKRIDISAETGYSDFIKNDESLRNQPIKLMSKLTGRILAGVNYENAKKMRIKNFEHLHKKLGKYNELKIDSKLNSPMIYPFFIKKNKLREKLNNNKIYAARYWDNVLKFVKKNTFEYDLVNFLLPIPIDQRNNEKELNGVINFILDEIKN